MRLTGFEIVNNAEMFENLSKFDTALNMFDVRHSILLTKEPSHFNSINPVSRVKKASLFQKCKK